MIKGKSTTMTEGCTSEILSGKFGLQFAMVQMAHENRLFTFLNMIFHNELLRYQRVSLKYIRKLGL